MLNFHVIHHQMHQKKFLLLKVHPIKFIMHNILYVLKLVIFHLVHQFHIFLVITLVVLQLLFQLQQIHMVLALMEVIINGNKMVHTVSFL